MNAQSHDQPPDHDASIVEATKPVWFVRLFAWPIATNWTCGFVLFFSMWLPTVRGCDGAIVVPYESAITAAEERGKSDAFMFAWPYLMGLAVAVIIVVCALFALPFVDRLLLGLLACFYAAICLEIWTETLFPDPPAPRDSAKKLLEGFLEQLPIHLIVLIWCGRAVAKRDWVTAWARLSNVMMFLAVCWLYVSHLFAKEHFYGFYVALIGIFGMFVGPWLFRIHWQRLLIDKSAPRQPLQFSIRGFLIFVTLFAVLYGYYRYLPELFDQ